MDLSGLELDQTLCALRGPPKNGCFMRCDGSVVVVISRVDHRVTGNPFDEGIRAGTDGLTQRSAAGCLEVFGRLDAVDQERELREECRVGVAQTELHGELVDCRDRLDLLVTFTCAGERNTLITGVGLGGSSGRGLLGRLRVIGCCFGCCRGLVIGRGRVVAVTSTCSSNHRECKEHTQKS